MRCRVVAPLLVVIACSGCGGAKKDVRVPNLVGASHEVALARLERAGLCVGTIRYVLSEPYEEVVRQSPRAGTMTVAHAEITLTIGPSGPSGSLFSDELAGCVDQPRYVMPSGV